MLCQNNFYVWVYIIIIIIIIIYITNNIITIIVFNVKTPQYSHMHKYVLQEIMKSLIYLFY